MCAIIPSVLCVKDVLNSIVKIAENISQTAIELEKRIVHKIQIDDNLHGSVNAGIELVSANLPPHQYHTGLFLLSNIDKVCFSKDLFYLNIIFFFFRNIWAIYFWRRITQWVFFTTQLKI